MLNNRIVPETVYGKINDLLTKNNGMETFVSTTNVSDVIKYARITQTSNHLRFLCKHPNICVLLEIAERQDKKATDLFEHLLLNNIDKPAVLNAISNNPKATLAGFISWVELSKKEDLKSNKTNAWKLWIEHQKLVANHPLNVLSKTQKIRIA